MREELIWAMHEAAIPGALDAVRRMTLAAAEGREGLFMGPAEDADRAGLPIQVSGSVAVIPLMGPMFRRAGPFARMFGIAGTDMTRMAIQAAAADEAIETILLRIDSPGGSVSGIEELAEAFANTGKSTVAQVEGTAGSAAYYVASQADRLVMGPGDMVGSIGVRTVIQDMSKMAEMEGVRVIAVDTGEFKSVGIPGLPVTDEHIADIQRMVDFYYDQFIARVSSARHLTDDQARAAGDGRMFTPQEALSLGLADDISTIDQTMAGLRPQRARSTDAARARLRI